MRSNPFAAVVGAFEDAFARENLETVFQTGTGFAGTLAASKAAVGLIPALDTPAGRIGASLGTTVLGTAVSGMIFDRVFATRYLVGGMVATVWRIVSELLAGVDQKIVPLLGDAETEEFKRAIEAEVLKEMRGSEQGIYLQPAGAAGMGTVQDVYIQPAGVEAYLTSREAESATMGAYLTEREAVEAGMGAEEFGTFTAAPERF